MILDLVAALVISYGFYRGFSKGLIGTVVDTLSILIAIVIALKFSPLLIDYIQDAVNLNASIEFILGFLIVFFLVIFILRFIADKIEDVLKATKINFINQIAGGALLGFVSAFLIGGLLMLLTRLAILNEDYAADSTLYSHLVKLSTEGSWVFETFKDLFTDFWSKFMATVDQIKTKVG